MAKKAIIRSGGKQYIVGKDDELYVDRLNDVKGKTIKLETLAYFEDEGEKVQLGSPQVKEQVVAEAIEEVKGDKIRIARFRAKTRYRRVRGFRPQFTKLKITKI